MEPRLTLRPLTEFQISGKPVADPAASFFYMRSGSGKGQAHMAVSLLLVEIDTRRAGDTSFPKHGFGKGDGIRAGLEHADIRI